MSVVAARVQEGIITMAADSIVVRSWGTQEKKPVKIFQTNNVLVGACGYAREIVFFKMYCEITNPRSTRIDDVLGFFIEYQEWAKNKIDDSSFKFENSYLIGFQGKLFSFNNYHVEEIEAFDAIGAGEDYALAALYLGHDPETAVRVACELCIYCEPPIIVLTQGGSQVDQGRI